MREKIIATIIDLEWGMFSSVHSAGQTSCQQDPVTFRIMRESQARTWSEKLLKSYLSDLTSAKMKGRNLMTEKYARMMESTHPPEFKSMVDRLPVVDEETLRLIEEIIAINVEWEEELDRRYPGVRAMGRTVHTRDDNPWVTSFETYLRGELRTYSPETIRIYHKDTINQKKLGINAAEKNLRNQVNAYGYDSLEEAEKRSSQIDAESPLGV